MRTLLAVSPHLDDAVFSAGASLWIAARKGWRVVVATVFTGNVTRPDGFALACQLDKGLGPDVDYMALRRAEDAEACEVLGATAVHLPLLEAPHRGYADAAALFGPLLADDRISVDVEREVSALLGEFRPDVLLGPLGIGAHVDHLIVREALATVGAPGARRLSWEDWPYADRARATDRRGAAALAITPGARAAKLRACVAYRSQIGFQFGGAGNLSEALSRQTAEYLHRTQRKDVQRSR